MPLSKYLMTREQYDADCRERLEEAHPNDPAAVTRVMARRYPKSTEQAAEELKHRGLRIDVDQLSRRVMPEFRQVECNFVLFAGSTPVVKIAGRGWKRISAAAALTVSPGDARGTLRRLGQFFRLYQDDIDGERCADFLRALLRSVRGKVILLWDGLAAHRSLPAKAVLARSPRVNVHRLPSYAPEFNPVEPMWRHAKGVGLRGVVPDDVDDLEIQTECVLDEIAERQSLLRSFFTATPLRIPGDLNMSHGLLQRSARTE